MHKSIKSGAQVLRRERVLAEEVDAGRHRADVASMVWRSMIQPRLRASRQSERRRKDGRLELGLARERPRKFGRGHKEIVMMSMSRADVVAVLVRVLSWAV